MATVVVAKTAVADLDRLIATRRLPANTRGRVRTSLEPLGAFPNLGVALAGQWQGLRMVLGPWPWMILVYVYDDQLDRVTVITIQDARAGSSPAP